MALTHTIASLRRVLADVPEDRYQAACDEFALTFDEWFAYEQAQALAHANGTLSREDAQTIYAALGGAYGHGGWTVGTDLATRIAVSHAMIPCLAAYMGVEVPA